MKKRTKNLLITSGIAAAGIAVLSTVHRKTSKYFMNLAFDRDEPKKAEKEKKKISSSTKTSDTVTAVLEAAQKLENSPLETVEISGRDGVTLTGHWFYNENAKRVIVAMHGWRSSWSQDFGIIAPFWQDNDCAVLYAEQRGQGASGGDYMGFGLLERYDCLEWINWVNERTGGELPVYLGGISMGATTVLMTGGLELPENVRGIVADCAFTSPRAIWKHVVESNLHLPYGIYSSAANELCKKKIQEDADYSTADALQNCDVPVMFIHGTDDRFVPIEMTYENYKACRSKKRLFVVPGAEHGMSYMLDKEGYEEAVKKFWEDNDK